MKLALCLTVLALSAALSPAHAVNAAKCKNAIEKDRSGNVLRCGDTPKTLVCPRNARIIYNRWQNGALCGDASKSVWAYAPQCPSGYVGEATRHEETRGLPYFELDCVTLAKATKSSLCAQQPWRCRTGKLWTTIENAVVPPAERAKREEECKKLGAMYLGGACLYDGGGGTRG